MSVVETKIFNKSAVRSLLSMKECIAITEDAFKLHAQGKIISPGLLHADTSEGEFHIKTGGIITSKSYFCLKCNGGFFQNRKKYGLPNIQGLILLYDGENGLPLAVFESGEITIQRTGAATAMAAKYLSNPASEVVTICGCGIQGRIQLQSLCFVKNLKKVFAYDIDKITRDKFIAEISSQLNIEIQPVDDLKSSIQQSQILITCTPSKKYFIEENFVKPGLFIAAVGADSPEKQEIAPELLAKNKVVADILAQSVSVGDTHHAVKLGLMKKENVFAEIGEIIDGKKIGRSSEDEIIIYDATGTALQDAAAAVHVYEKSLKENTGQTIRFQG